MEDKKKVKVEDKNASSTSESVDPFHSEAFTKVHQYIRETGLHKRVSVSAIAGDTSKMVDYYSIEKDKFKLTVDHSKRIYIEYNGNHIGNLYLDQDSVYVEPYHMKMGEDMDTLTDIIDPIWALYEMLILEIDK
ncbi:MAG: hypothetical protein R2799_07475 [Crocinitomicaceae bacterium]